MPLTANSYPASAPGFPPGPGLYGPEEAKRSLRPELSAEELAGLGAVATEFQLAATDEAVAQPADRNKEVYRLTRNPDTYEVTVESDVTLEDVRRETHPDDWAFIKNEAEPLKGTTWVFINPTMEGGGVAMIRPPAVHDLKELGIQAHWYVMEPIQDKPKGNPFIFTKSMHNILQRQTDDRITEEGKALHWHWADTENGPVLERQEPILNADFIVIDDPQPAPLIRRLKAANPNAKIIWRNHIDTDGDLMADPNTSQGEVASYLLDECGVADVDAVITHPVPAFVHPELDDKTYFAPATFDHFDNLNRHLTEEEQIEGIEFINAEIVKKNEKLEAAGRFADIQPLLSLDPDTKRVTLIARFDPSKRPDLAMEMGVLTKRKMRSLGLDLDEIVIIGNGSHDDTDGKWMYEETLRIRREQYPDEADSIIVTRLKHNYDAMNAAMSKSTIMMQTSDAEGLETRASDGIKHGKPVVVSNRGGIKTQVVEGESGIILDYDKPGYDLERGAEFMARLLTDPVAYKAMIESTARQAKIFNLREFTTPANVARLLRIGNRLLEEPRHMSDKLWKMSEMVATESSAGERELLAA
jgi:glycosyltransferase involved in cell wall biosynthesis